MAMAKTPNQDPSIFENIKRNFCYNNSLLTILIHILNNSLSVYFTQTFPEANTLSDIIGNQPYYISLILAIVLLVVSVWSLDKKKG